MRGASTASSHAMWGARAPRETPGPRGAHLAAAKANLEEKQIGAACDALVPGFGLGFCFMWLMPGSSPLHASLVPLPSPHMELLLLWLWLHVSLPSPVTQSAKLLLECENSYCLPDYPDASDAMIKYFARPDPVSV